MVLRMGYLVHSSSLDVLSTIYTSEWDAAGVLDGGSCSIGSNHGIPVKDIEGTAVCEFDMPLRAKGYDYKATIDEIEEAEVLFCLG